MPASKPQQPPSATSADFRWHNEAMRVLPIRALAERNGRDRVGIRLLIEKAMKRTRVERANGNWVLRIDCSSKICPNGRMDVVGAELAGAALTVLFGALYEDNPNLFAPAA